MKKIIRLTESDLTRLVRRVIMEQQVVDFKKVPSGKLTTNHTLVDSINGQKIEPVGIVSELRSSDRWETFNKEVPNNMEWSYELKYNSNNEPYLELTPVGKKFAANYTILVKNMGQ